MSKRIYVDHLKRTIILNDYPKRVISIVPSITELIINLGLKHLLIGITNYCIHPQKETDLIRKIGGTKTPKIDLILDLAPDIVIANKEENKMSDIEVISKHTSVWVSDINSYEDNFKLIIELGKLFNKNSEATTLCAVIKNNWRKVPEFKSKSCLYFIWRNPYMLAGKDTFINSVLAKSGFENLISQNRYPTQNIDELSSLSPELILLSTEPYCFKEKHISEFRKLFPNAIIKIVDGELFSWYGSRQKLLPSYLIKLKKSL